MYAVKKMLSTYCGQTEFEMKKIKTPNSIFKFQNTQTFFYQVSSKRDARRMPLDRGIDQSILK